MNILHNLLPIFGETIFPVVFVASCGFILARRMQLDSRTIGRTAFYLFSPALIFRSLYQMDLDYATVGRTMLVATVIMLSSALLGWLISWDQERRQRSAIVLATAMSNNGNMGLPLSLFALGQVGLSLATIYFVTNAFLGNTVGVFIASAGNAPPLQAIKRTLKVPVLYSAIAGLVMGYFDVQIPMSLARPIDLMAAAAVPVLLVLLGVQLSSAPIASRQSVLSRTVLVRLVGGPLLAVTLVLLLGIHGVERNVMILQSGMPTAVTATVLATEFDAAPRLVATAIFFSTAASLVTVTLLLSLIA